MQLALFVRMGDTSYIGSQHNGEMEMHSINVPGKITESKAMEIIFQACRANEKRNTVKVYGYDVKFVPSGWGNDEYRAHVYDVSNNLIARAIIDMHDN